MGSPFEGSPRAGAAEYVHKGDVYNIKKAVPQKNSFFFMINLKEGISSITA
jgi:hypothetical protein